VALVTADPAPEPLSALYGALMSESPVVLLSGASPLGQAGRGAFRRGPGRGAAPCQGRLIASKAERLTKISPSR